MTIDEQLEALGAELVVLKSQIDELDAGKRKLMSRFRSIEDEVLKLLKEKAGQKALPF